MKSFISYVLLIVMCAALLAGCAQPAKTNEKPGDPTSKVETPATTPDGKTTDPATSHATEPDPTTRKEEPGEYLDMEGFLLQIANENPGADAETLCRKMLESPYFTLFEPLYPVYYTPGVNFEYSIRDAGDSYSVVDYNTGDVVIVITPAEGKDPETLMKELTENASPSWTGGDGAPDQTLVKMIEGKVYFALYHSKMRPITVYASKARDFIEMFHNYCKANPNATCTEMAQYFVRYQKLAQMHITPAEEGQLRGFGQWNEESGWYDPVDVTGFADGARFEPRMEPNAFMGYVFTVKEGTDVNAFAAMLKEYANLAYNVCTSVNSCHTEIDGNRVLFMMFNEEK